MSSPSPKRSGGPPSLEARLFEDGHDFDFFQAVRILQKKGGRALVGFAGPPNAEAARFRAHVSLSFPPSAIHQMVRSGPDQPTPVMIQAFLGLTGPSGVLPRHYTETIYRLERERGGRELERHALRDWLDLFNHRLTSHFYRAWEKYRFFVPFERTRADQEHPDLFTLSLYSLMGLGTPSLRGRQRVAIRIPGEYGEHREQRLAKIESLALIRYSGLFARQIKSATGLQAILADYFGLPVAVKQFQGQWLQIEPRNQSRLEDGGNNQLGVSTVVGQRVWDIQSKFRLRFGSLNYAQFLEFLPDRSPTPERKSQFLLSQLVRLYTGHGLEFDIQLVLRQSEVPECQLAPGEGFGARLGWNTWLISEEPGHDPEDAVFEGTDVIWVNEDAVRPASQSLRGRF